MRLLCLIRVCLLVDLLLNRAGGEVEGADDLVREADGADELTTTTSSFWNLVSGFCCACPQRFCCGCVAVSWQRFQICSLWITCSTRLSHFNSHLLIIISDAPCQSRVLICPSSKVQLSWAIKDQSEAMISAPLLFVAAAPWLLPAPWPLEWATEKAEPGGLTRSAGRRSLLDLPSAPSWVLGFILPAAWRSKKHHHCLFFFVEKGGVTSDGIPIHKHKKGLKRFCDRGFRVSCEIVLMKLCLPVDYISHSVFLNWKHHKKTTKTAKSVYSDVLLSTFQWVNRTPVEY